jgi:hypothetical protein
MGRKFSWDRIDQNRSIAQANDVISMRVECDGDGCEWTVTGWARDRAGSIKRAEDAALAAIRAPEVADDRLDALMMQAHAGTSYLVVNGQREPHTLFEVLRLARQAKK